MTARQPQYDTVIGDGQYVLQLAHPVAVPKIQGKLDLLGKKWTDLRKRMGKRIEQCMYTLTVLSLIKRPFTGTLAICIHTCV